MKEKESALITIVEEDERGPQGNFEEEIDSLVEEPTGQEEEEGTLTIIAAVLDRRSVL